MPTAIIVDRFRAGDSLAEMAGDYGVAEAEIEEALKTAGIPFIAHHERFDPA